MPREFFGMAAKIAVSKGLSLRRIEYIVEQLMLNYHYPTITIADIFSIDKFVKTYTYGEFYRTFGATEKEGYCILEKRGIDGGILYAETELAKQARLKIKRECFNV
jgi:hypothetical protein